MEGRRNEGKGMEERRKEKGWGEKHFFNMAQLAPGRQWLQMMAQDTARKQAGARALLLCP